MEKEEIVLVFSRILFVSDRELREVEWTKNTHKGRTVVGDASRRLVQ